MDTDETQIKKLKEISRAKPNSICVSSVSICGSTKKQAARNPGNFRRCGRRWWES
jgi:hypothetical protein